MPDRLETRPCRSFGIGKLSSAHNSDRYNIGVADVTLYEKNKAALMSVMQKSAGMATVDWGKRLKIDYKSGSFSSASETLENNEEEVAVRCVKYLDPEFKYQL